MSPPIFNPDGPEVNEIVLPDGATASEVIGPDGNVVFEAGPEIPDSALAQDLVAWYRFEDGDARDYASNAEYPNVTWGDSTAYDGTVGGATYQASGGITDFETGANSGYFDVAAGEAASRYSDVGTTVSDVSGMAWVRIPGINNNYPGIISALDSSAANDYENGFTFQFYQSNGALDFEAKKIFPDHAPTNSSTRVGSGIPTNQWVHVAFSYNSSTGDVIFYVDGSSAISFSGSSGVTFNLERITIGERYFNSIYNESLGGDIDDARIYNKTLSASEVSAIYNATKP